MNKKAEDFKKYLKEKNITVFVDEELDDKAGTTVFRSHVEVEGRQLPLLVIIDNSIYVMIRVQVSPRAAGVSNRQNLFDIINALNEKYKPFKLYLDNNGDLISDSCIVAEKDLKGEVIYALFGALINFLNDNYRRIMKVIWTEE